MKTCIAGVIRLRVSTVQLESLCIAKTMVAASLVESAIHPDANASARLERARPLYMFLLTGVGATTIRSARWYSRKMRYTT